MRIIQYDRTVLKENNDYYFSRANFYGIKLGNRHCTRHKTRQSAFVPGSLVQTSRMYQTQLKFTRQSVDKLYTHTHTHTHSTEVYVNITHAYKRRASKRHTHATHNIENRK